MLNSNKGKYIESIINNSILYYELNNIALFRKNYPEYKIIKAMDKYFLGKFLKKADVDYYGIYQGKFICFEAKQTINDKFSLSQILEHQDDFFKKIKHLNKHVPYEWIKYLKSLSCNLQEGDFLNIIEF